jgi:uncharacterized protein (DUF2062 family)
MLRANALKKLTRSTLVVQSNRACQQTLFRQSILSIVNQNKTIPTGIEPASAPVHHNWLYRRVALPILALLRLGATPEKLAWSIAVGLLIGINPIIGSTTILCLAVAFIFRLNIAASQIGNHIVYPLELLLVIPLLRLGSLVFRTESISLSPKEFLDAAKTHPITLTRQLWQWEWHAFLVWACISVIAAPLIALALTPLFRRLLLRVERHQYPIITTT